MIATTGQIRAWTCPAPRTCGFRSFFLGAALDGPLTTRPGPGA